MADSIGPRNSVQKPLVRKRRGFNWSKKTSKKPKVISAKYFKVEDFIDLKFVNNTPLFMVKWEGYDCTHNSWVRFEDFNQTCRDRAILFYTEYIEEIQPFGGGYSFPHYDDSQ